MPAVLLRHDITRAGAAPFPRGEGPLGSWAPSERGWARGLSAVIRLLALHLHSVETEPEATENLNCALFSHVRPLHELDKELLHPLVYHTTRAEQNKACFQLKINSLA